MPGPTHPKEQGAAVIMTHRTDTESANSARLVAEVRHPSPMCSFPKGHQKNLRPAQPYQPQPGSLEEHTPLAPYHPHPMNSPLLPLDHWLLGNRRKALVLAATLAAFVPICWIVIQARGSFPGDSDFISWMRHPHPPEPVAFLAHVFMLLGRPIVAAATVAIVWALVNRHLGRRYGVLVLMAVAAVALNAALKTILGPTTLQMQVFGERASSNFPSGHVVYTTSLCGLVAWFALARDNRPVVVAMMLPILGMGPFRVIDGAHWPSDVLAGYALGLALTIVVLVIGLPWAASQSARDRGAKETA
jgi:membrane-associated phospholipid phosphatase